MVKKKYFFVLNNGIRELLSGSVQTCEYFFKYHNARIRDYQRSFFLLMVCGISFVVLSQIILIPIIKSVNKTNHKVLALFGYIKSDQIASLLSECEKFIEKYIDTEVVNKK